MPLKRRAIDYRVDPFDLRLFEAVIESGTITAAAQAMSLSLAAASTRLQALEHRVGTKLLDRSKTGAKPTVAGQAFARQSRRVLAELDSLHIEMAAFGQGLRGNVRLLCNTAAGSEVLPLQLGRFLVDHPDIDVELKELSSEAILDALRRGIADVGIVADHVDTGGLVSKAWIDDQLVAVLPAKRRGLESPPLRFAELLDRPFVGLPVDSGLSRFLMQQAARSGRVQRHRVRVSTFDAVARMVEAGVGVAVMPLAAASRWNEARVQIAALKDPWAKRTLLVCSTAEAETLPGVRSLIDALLSTQVSTRRPRGQPAHRGAPPR